MSTTTMPANVRQATDDERRLGWDSITELSRRTFRATRLGTAQRAGVRHIGPCLVDVIVTQVTKVDGTTCKPSYFVHIDGVPQCGGVAAHLSDEDGLPERIDMLVLLGTELSVNGELCDHSGDVIERTAHGYLGDRPAGTVERLCADCGTELIDVTDGLEWAAPFTTRRGYFDGTECANCGELIRRERHRRPGRTDLLGEWVHVRAGIRDPRLCASAAR